MHNMHSKKVSLSLPDSRCIEEGGGTASCQAMSAEALKAEGNAHFAEGRLDAAMASYESALDFAANDGGPTPNGGDQDRLLRPTVLANLGLCHLRLGEMDGCIDRCSEAIRALDARADARADADRAARLRSKALYRRARARYGSLPPTAGGEAVGEAGGEAEKTNATALLNEAARDLLEALRIEPGSRDAAALLAAVRERHGRERDGAAGGGSEMARALASLGETGGASDEGASDEGGGGGDAEGSLRKVLALLSRDAAAAAAELGRRGGVRALWRVADARQRPAQVRVLALRSLAAACSHASFVRRYATPAALPQGDLASLVAEDCAAGDAGMGGEGGGGGGGSRRDVAVAAVALYLRLVVHLGRTDPAEGTSSTAAGGEDRDVDRPSVCRAIVATLTAEGGGSVQRSGLDLLSAWTAADADAVAEAAEAADVNLYEAKKGRKDGRLTDEELRRTLKPKEYARHKRGEYEARRRNQERARESVAHFCDVETGGLDALLECAVRSDDHSLRREAGAAVGRLAAAFGENDDDDDDDDRVKRIAAPLLGYSGSIGAEESKDGDNTLTIEEIKDDDEGDGSGGGSGKGESLSALELAMRRGQLVSSLLLGKPEVGAWAFKDGWDDGQGINRLEMLISSGDMRAMSIAAEILSAAASAEKGRSLLTPLVERGVIEDLLLCEDREVRSGAASAVAKLGLANKDLSSDEGQIFGLLQVAAELLMDTEGKDASVQRDEVLRRRNWSPSESSAVDRGVEVLSYLCSKTNIKEEIAHGFKIPSSTSDSVLGRLVELASLPTAGESPMAYGIATAFALIAVSNQTLREEAFSKSEITSEQYDQLQDMGKTAEEKEMEKKLQDKDSRQLVNSRISKMANANVPRAMVKLMDGASEPTKEQLTVGLNRMAIDESVRGLMIQQGCLSALLKIEKGKEPSETEKKTWQQARHCVAKLLVTTNPGLLTVSQRMGSIGPLIQLIHDHESSDLSTFEALMAVTNLASVDDEMKNRVVAEKGIQRLSYAMFSDHDMVRRAATEAMSNLIPHPEMIKHLSEADNIRLWIAFARSFEEDLECSRAAIGCLAMASQHPDIANKLAEASQFDVLTRDLLECGNLELMHRALVTILTLLEHGGKCKDAVIASGSGAFCRAYVQSYEAGNMANEVEFSAVDKQLMLVTVDLSKGVASAC